MGGSSNKGRPGRALAVGFVALAGVWLSSACGSEVHRAKLAEGCTLSSDCNSPLKCVFQRCHAECKDSGDCPLTARCVKGTDTVNVCQIPEERDCHEDADCKGEEQCAEDKECRDPCHGPADCTPQQVCSSSGNCAETRECTATTSEPDSTLCTLAVRSEPSGTGGSGSAGAGGTSNHSDGGAGGTIDDTDPAGGGGTSNHSDSGAGGMSDAEAGAGGDGSLDADGCPRDKKNCDRTNPDCETDVSVVTACGACDVSCKAIHGIPICRDFQCVVPSGGCDANYADCNHDAANGCETPLLTDANNCGACGRACGVGPCTNGKCATVTVDAGHAYILDVYFSSDKVWWATDSQDPTPGLHFIPREPQTLPATATVVPTTSINSLTGDASSIYFLRKLFNAATQPASNLRKVSSDGTGLIQPLNDNVGLSMSLRSNATAFFMLSAGDQPTSIVTLAKTATGLPIPIISGRRTIRQFLVTASRLVWIEENGTSDSSASIYVAPLKGGTGSEIKLATDTLPWDADYWRAPLAADGSYLYWSEPASGKVRRYALDSSGVAEDLAFDLSSPKGIAVDEQYVYFLGTSPGHYGVLFRLKKTGAALPEIITTESNMSHLWLVDERYVWGDSLYNIVRTPK